MSNIEQRLRELGCELPEPPAVMANYVSCVQTGNLIFTLPFNNPIEIDLVVGVKD